MRLRRGLSLLELLVVVAILALVMGFGLAAVHRARMTALRMKSANNLRQIALATQQLADHNGGVIKDLIPTNIFSTTNPSGSWDSPHYAMNMKDLFTVLLPWTCPGLPGFPPFPKQNMTSEDMEAYLSQYDVTPYVAVYVSPADPSLAFMPVKPPGTRMPLAFGDAPCSYSFNAQVLSGTVSLPAGVPDGMSNTVSYAERYHLCGLTVSSYRNWNDPRPPRGPSRQGGSRPSFADPACYDVIPVRLDDGRTVASQPGKTFQVRPSVALADTAVPQTPYDGGLLVAFFDGSVRTIRGGVSESSFWGMVTPAGGEVFSDD